MYTECAFILENVVRKVCGEPELNNDVDETHETSSIPSQDIFVEGGDVEGNGVKYKAI